MSQANVELLYRWYEAFRAHDNEACVRDVFGVFPDWHARVVQTIDHGDVVVAEIRMAGRGATSGLEVEQTTWQVTRFRDGKLAGFTAYGDRAEALAAVGLSD